MSSPGIFLRQIQAFFDAAYQSLQGGSVPADWKDSPERFWVDQAAHYTVEPLFDEFLILAFHELSLVSPAVMDESEAGHGNIREAMKFQLLVWLEASLTAKQP